MDSQTFLFSRCRAIGLGAMLGTSMLWGSSAAYAQSAPDEADFQREVVAEGLDLPMEFEISADGRVFIASKCGGVYAWNLDSGSPAQTSTVPNVRCVFEDGLLSVALDPNFTQNSYIYFQYTAPGSITRVSRFTVNADNSLDVGSESVLLEWITGDEAHGHMGGSLQFDTQGNLLITTGDNKAAGGYFQPSAQGTSGNTNDMRGKILRITPTADGGYTIPPGNLFAGDALRRPEIYGMGFRNPFRLSVDPATNCSYVGDIGPDASTDSAEGPGGLDEINEICSAGNYGWPYIIGYNQPYAGFDPNNIVNNASDNTGATNLPNSVGALWTVRHQATMAGPVYRLNEGIDNPFKLPAYYNGKLIFWDFNSSRFSTIDLSSPASPPVAEPFPINTQGFQGAIDAELDPRTHQLYVLQWGSGCCDKEPYGGGALYRFDYVGNRDSGTNVALGGVASASSEVAGNLAAYAIDGDPSTRWESDASDPQSLTVELAEAVTIGSISIVWEGAYSSRYVIEGSNDGQSWTPLAEELAGSGGTRLHIIDSSEAYRYVRLTGTERGTGYGHSIFEFEVYAGEVEEPPEELTEHAYLNMPRTLDANFTDVPLLLSQTGAFADTANLVPSAHLIPFEPNTKLWSDRALKTRWLSLPAERQVEWHQSDDWGYPQGTVAVKHFELPLVGDGAGLTKRLETRLIVMQANGRVYGVTYKWRDDNSDAELLTTSVLEDIVVTRDDGSSWTQTWAYPSPTECIDCHNPDSAQILGLSTRQLNGEFSYPDGSRENQLVHWNNLGLFSPGFDNASVGSFDKMVAITDTSASLEQRVKSYLDTNCAHCHGTGNGGSQWDARYNTPLAQMRVVGEATTGIRNYLNYYGIDNAEVVTPGAPHQSILYIRDQSENPDDRMPPIGRALEHPEYIAVLEQWIDSLDGTTPPPTTGLISGNASATATSVEAEYAADYATDGDPTTRWASEFADPQSLTVDLQQVYRIDRIVLNWEAAYGSAYVIEGSLDGQNWEPVYSQEAGVGGEETLENLSGNYRYLRLTGTQRGTEWGYSLWEFEVYGGEPVTAAEPELVSQNKAVTVSSTEADYAGALVVDGDATTRWSSEFADPQWVQIDLGELYALDRIELSWEAAHASAYIIEGSTDGSAWSELVSVGNAAGGDVVHDGLSGSFRYVRLTGTERATEWGYSLFEMAVWGVAGSGDPGDNPGTPSLSVNAPVSGQSYLEGEAVIVSASASASQWFADGNGLLVSVDGAVAEFSAASTVNLGALAAGAHTIVVQLADSEAQAVGNSVSLNVVVNERNTNPAELLSLNKSASSSEVEGDFVAANAVDDDLGTRWSSAHDDANHYLQIDLGASYPLGRVELEWEAAYATGYRIEVSGDAASWSEVFSTSNGDGGLDTVDVSASGRYVRLTGTSRATAYGYSLWEMRVYSQGDVAPTAQLDVLSPLAGQTFAAGEAVTAEVSVSDSDWFTDGGSYRYTLDANAAVTRNDDAPFSLGVLNAGGHTFDVTLVSATGSDVGAAESVTFYVAGGETPTTPSPAQLSPIQATASSEVGGNLASYTIDSIYNSRWESEIADPQFLTLDMGQSVYLTRVRLDWEAAYARVYRLEVSADGNEWTSIYENTNSDGGVDDIALNGEQGRYLRVYGTERATGYGYSLFEVEVFGLPADPSLAMIDVLSPANGASVAETDAVTLSVNISDSSWLVNGGAYRYQLNDQAPVTVNQLADINLGTLPTGRHTLAVTLVDSTGAAVSVPRSHSFTVNCGADCPNVLVFSKTSGFRHGSIPAGIAMVEAIADDYGYGFTASEDAAVFTDAGLAQYDTIVFMNTTGDIFTDSQKAAFRSYIENGGGYVGSHSAADTEHGWDWYTDVLLAGAEFIHHGDGIPMARVEIEQQSDPLVSHIGSDWNLADEWYFWESSPRGVGNVQVLGNLDRSSYTSNYPVDDHPVIFKNTVGSGRVFYTAIGHVDANFSDPNMIEMMRKAIEWTSQ
ncbi:discoidin domain-containing protein [Gilvimarinus sp. DA14]|uniref:discoidin domain-containing protein n=1 Tax=Gilvimarinus sp. DA14 TaxID=2956798 RepID=UPI0020B720C5|nr:discoidin domain-containing protein [Gilvimarinus sp. DA14]UTF59468.1 discoidin domain-containing protein [Gilvimarinus sp. DA14]